MSKTYGTREEVFNEEAKKTRSGLTKEGLMMNPKGKIVSKKKYESGLKLYKNMKSKLCGTIDQEKNKAILEDTKKILQRNDVSGLGQSPLRRSKRNKKTLPPETV